MCTFQSGCCLIPAEMMPELPLVPINYVEHPDQCCNDARSNTVIGKDHCWLQNSVPAIRRQFGREVICAVDHPFAASEFQLADGMEIKTTVAP
ncbi:hypothetical protein FKM82_006863 [Ascaphus truei]